LPLHLVLEYNAADDNGYSSGELAHEAEGGRRSCIILRRNQSLQGDERGQKVGSCNKPREDVEYDNSGPVRLGREIDEEADTESHKEKAYTDGFDIVPCFIDKDAGADRGEGEGEDEWKEIDT